jgi:small-conductance mechanosensitive channel
VAPPFALSSTAGDVLLAVVILIATVIVARVVDRLLSRRGGGLTRRLSRQMSAADATRMRVARRLIVAAILFVGIAAALVQLPEVGTLARGLLASAGITAIIVGFAARSVLANLVAGVMVALAQPIRLGDEVSVDDVTGCVEEMTLTYTYIRTPDNRRVMIPNEQLASKVIHNFSIVDEASGVAADFVVPAAAPLADVTRVAAEEARAVNRLPEREPTLAVLELGPDDVKLRATVWGPDKPAADAAAADLRLRLAERLKAEGLVPGGSETAGRTGGRRGGGAA